MKKLTIISTALLATFLLVSQRSIAQQPPIIIVDGLEIPFEMLTRFDPSLIEKMEVIDNKDQLSSPDPSRQFIALTLKEPYPLITLNGTELQAGIKLGGLGIGPLLSITGLNAQDAIARFGDKGANGAIIIFEKLQQIIPVE